MSIVDPPAEGVQSPPSDHRLTISFAKIGFPELHFRCHEPEGAACRTVCPEPECEEGCVDLDRHVRERVDYCNIEEWLNSTDDVENAIVGYETSVTARIEFDWMGEGVDWRFAR